MLVIVARYLTAPDGFDEVLRHVRRLAAASRAEAGCLEYTVLRPADRDCELVLLERYVDADAFRAHVESEHYKEIGRGLIHPLLDDREVLRCDVEDGA